MVGFHCFDCEFLCLTFFPALGMYFENGVSSYAFISDSRQSSCFLGVLMMEKCVQAR